MNASSPERHPDSSSGAVIVAAAVIGFGCLILLFLYVLLGPLLLAFALFGVLAGLFGLLHYWMWGRSISSDDLENST